MTRKLTTVQIYTLNVLAAAGDWRGSYPALNLATLGALKAKGLVTSKAGVGVMAMPHTSIKWRITTEGRAALTSGGRDGQ